MNKALASVRTANSECELCAADASDLHIDGKNKTNCTDEAGDWRDLVGFVDNWNWAEARKFGRVFPTSATPTGDIPTPPDNSGAPVTLSDTAEPGFPAKPPAIRNKEGGRLRSALFSTAFYGFSTILALVAAVATFVKGGFFRKVIHTWARGIVTLMNWLVGITVDVRGREHIPQDGQYLVAAKHQAFGDGIVMMSELPDLAFVAEERNLRWPVLGRILKKMDAILVDTCGGETQRRRVSEGGRKAAENGKSILIYPEGRLVPVGAPTEYKTGIYFLYADLGLPVVPVATNLGLRWQCRRWRKFGGPAAIEFLEPIQPGLDKETFMALLEERVETASNRLVAEVS